MRDHETVTEVRAEAALRVAVPLAMGSNVGKGVEDLLRSADEVRHVAGVESGNVEKESDRLRVDATAELVVHLPHPSDGDGAAAVRAVLEDQAFVDAVERLSVRESYPIEAY